MIRAATTRRRVQFAYKIEKIEELTLLVASLYCECLQLEKFCKSLNLPHQDMDLIIFDLTEFPFEFVNIFECFTLMR